MSAPTDTELRDKFEALAVALFGESTQVLKFWALSFNPGDDMTVLRHPETGRVDTLMISAAGLDQTPRPHSAVPGRSDPRGKNVVGRKYRTWLFNESEQALIVALEAWRRMINEKPTLDFEQGKAIFIDSVDRLQVPLIDSFPTGDPETPVAFFAQAELVVRVIEPQEQR